MRICPCGGHVRQHQLTQSREAWTCGSCGRYEVMSRPATNGDQKPTEKLTSKNSLLGQQADANGGAA